MLDHPQQARIAEAEASRAGSPLVAGAIRRPPPDRLVMPEGRDGIDDRTGTPSAADRGRPTPPAEPLVHRAATAPGPARTRPAEDRARRPAVAAARPQRDPGAQRAAQLQRLREPQRPQIEIGTVEVFVAAPQQAPPATPISVSVPPAAPAAAGQRPARLSRRAPIFGLAQG